MRSRFFPWTAPMVLALLPLQGCGDDELTCGEGTVRDGDRCVVAMGTDGHGDDGAAFDGDDEEDESGSSVDPYGSCYSGSDAECAPSEFCNPEINVCESTCGGDQECPGPAEGDAVQACRTVGVDHGCVLTCANGLTCPEGMSCVEGEPGTLCVWQ